MFAYAIATAGACGGYLLVIVVRNKMVLAAKPRKRRRLEDAQA